MRGELQAAVERRILTGTSWMGVPTQKQPMDAWVYQEIIWELKPDWIVEIGNHAGGSLHYLASICELVGNGCVLGVDKDRSEFKPRLRTLERIEIIDGDALKVFRKVAAKVDGRVLVIEDSAHTYDHTLAVLRTYSELVTVGSYLICEDGVMPDVADALQAFKNEDGRFVTDYEREWPVTWNPGGYLLRVK